MLETKSSRNFQLFSLEITAQHPTVLKLPYDPAVLLLIILPKRIENISISLYTNVHSIIIHKSQRVRTTQVFLQLVNDEQNADYPYNGTVFIHKKEWSADTCYEMHGP